MQLTYVMVGEPMGTGHLFLLSRLDFWRTSRRKGKEGRRNGKFQLVLCVLESNTMTPARDTKQKKYDKSFKN